MRPDAYLAPTKHVDDGIASRRKMIRDHKRSIRKLKKEREAIIESFRDVVEEI